MNVYQFIADLQKLDVRLFLDGEKLKVNAPEGALTPDIVENIRDYKNEIISFLSKTLKGDSSSDSIEKKLEDRDRFPLSFAQQRLWFFEKLNPDTLAYNMSGLFKVNAKIDERILRQSLDYIVQRHEILRTVFKEDENGIYQSVLPTIDYHFSQKDLSDIDSEERQKIISDLSWHEANNKFDLEKGPLFRVTWIKDTFSTSLLLMSMHHIISDGWSVEVLLYELKKVYSSLLRGEEPSLSQLPIQYGDFAAWQRERMQGDLKETQLKFWVDELKGVPEVLRLPTDRKRPAVQTFKGDTVELILEKSLREDIQKLSNNLGATAFMVLLASYQILLSKYSGQDDFCVGIPIAGRNNPQIQDLIGFFINALVIRGKPKADISAADYIGCVKETSLNVFNNQDLPAETLLDALNIKRSLSYEPLAQVGFTLQNYPERDSAADEIEITLLKEEHVTAKYDLTLYAFEIEESINLVAEYNTDLFDRETIEGMLLRYQRILEQITTDKDISIKNIELLTNKEILNELLIDINEKSEALPLSSIPLSSMSLSSMQRDLYLSTIKDPDTKKNSLGYAVEIHNEINVDIWQEELQRFHNNYAALKARYVAASKQYMDVAYQIIPSEDPIDFEFLDYSLENSFEKKSRLFNKDERDTLYQKLIFRSYNLSKENPVYYWLIKFADNDYVAVMASHHIVMDGVAYANQILTVCENYQRRINGEDILPLEEDIFEDFLSFDKANTDSIETVRYWSDRLKGVSALELPSGSKPDNFSIEEENAGEFQEKVLILDDQHWNDIKKYCRKNRVTPTIYFKVLYCLLLNSQCNADGDFVINEFSAGRPKGHQQGIGCYYQQQLYIFPHESIDEKTTFSELLSYSREFQKEVSKKDNLSIFYQNQLLSQSDIGFMYNFIHFFPTLKLFGKEEKINQYMARVDGQVQFVPKIIDGRCHLNLYYFENQFKDNNFLERIEYISQQVLDDFLCKEQESTELVPQKPVSEIQLATKQELDIIHNQWNNTFYDFGYDSKTCVHTIIEQAVDNSPDSIALIFEDISLTYSELEERANEVANYLINNGTKPNDIVAICCERSIDMVVGLLGIIKAGAAYLPIDTSLPQQRVQFMLEDASVNTVLTQKQFLDRFENSVDLEDDFSGYGKQRPSLSKGNKLTNDNLFNLIYTSGSTGVPKGVMVPHKGIINRIKWMHKEYGLTHDDLIIQKTPYSFDVSVWEFFWPLMVGSRLLIAKPDGHKDPEYLCEQIIQNSVTKIHFVPSMLNAFLQSEKVSLCNSLKMVFCSGEALSPETTNRFSDLLLAELHNLYGPTEASVDVSYWPVPKTTNVRIPIGKPIDNIKLYVLDRFKRLLPPGIPGELFISGIGLAKGYLNRDELNKNSFINNPYEEDYPYDRIYKTGDLTCYLDDGNIDYLGRIDHQVKLRGLRIELGEIESKLIALEQIKDAAVIVVGMDSGKLDQNLVAFIVSSDPLQELDRDLISKSLKEQMPDYMVPAIYHELDVLPLSANGKLDRKALANIKLDQRVTEYLAPRNDLEEAVADIWSEILNIDAPGINDSFFELGGHSLLATKVISRIREVYDIDIPLKDIFTSPTIATLAEIIQSELGGDSIDQHSALPAIEPVSRSTNLPLSFAQKRLYFLARLNPENSSFNMAAAIRLKGDLDTDAFIRTLQTIVDRHEVFRTTFIEDDTGDVWQEIKTELDINLTVEECIESDFEDDLESYESKIAQQEYDYSFNFDGENLFRFRLLKSAENRYLFTITLHHIISDGWSVAVFLKELVTLYEGYSSGDLSFGNLSSGNLDAEELLPKLDVQYADYAYWQNKYLEGEILEGQLDYWRENLKGAPELLRLPTDRPRPKVQTYNGALCRFTISADLTEKLETFAKEKQVTPFMVLLSAYQLLLSKYSNQNDVCVGIPVAGRNHKEIENLIGFFINALVIRGKLEGNHNTEQLLANIKESTLGAFANQDIPAETLLDVLKVKRNLGYSPLAQVGFALQNIAFEEGVENTGYQLKGLEIEQLEAEHVSAKYDLTLMLNESKSTDKKGIVLKELVGVAEYNTDLFNESTIERMMVHYVRLLEQMISEPELGIEKLSLLTEAELCKELNIDKENYQRIMPLTAMQRDLYLATVMDPDTIQNSLGYAVEIHSKIDKNLWKQELQRFVDSQSILRTEIIDANLPYTDVAYQCVLKHKEIEIEEVDLTTHNATEDELEELIESHIYRRYDPNDKYYVHNALIKLAEDHYITILATHHMLLDGVGFAQQLLTVTKNYERVLNKQKPEVAEDIFADFVEYDLRETDKAEVVERWKERLKDVEPLNIKQSSSKHGSSKKPYNKQSTRIAKSIQLSDEHFTDIKKYCRKQKITPAHYFKTLYGLMINLYCNAENDFKISEFTAGRPKGHQNGTGCYYQVLPYIFRQEHLGPKNPISGLFSYAREYQKEIRNDQQLSIFKQRQLSPDGNAGFMYNYIHFYPRLEFLGKEEFIQQLIPDAEGQVQLAVKVVDDVLNLYLDYQSNLFGEDKFLERLESLSTQILNGTENLADLKYITAEEEIELNNLNKNTKVYPQTSLQQLLNEAVEKYEDQIAVIKGDEKTNYKELYNKAIAVAAELNNRGIEKGDRVCICLGKDSNLIAAITGTILAGGCYVPMDPGYPVERLKYIKDDSQAKLLISEECLKEKLKPESGTLYIEELNLKDHLENNNYQPIEIDPEDLLYMIYTSGSTGKPKGSLVTHGNELNLQNWYIEEYGYNQNDKHLVISAIGFDLTQKNLIAPLLSGGTIVFTETEDYDPQEIANTIEREKVTTINCAPSAFYQVAHDHPFQLSSLKTVLFGGEGIKLEELGEWKNITSAKLVNMYGPTECTDITTSYTIDDLASYKEKTIPIGRPIPNVQTYICNRVGQLLPPGLEGELCIAGVSVGAGYFNREELTAEKFISTTYADRLYRTGDIVKYIIHQETPQIEYHLEYIERIDYQVKVRGQRIELGEIEEALKAQTGIRDAIVLVEEEKIWAYIIEKREELKEELNLEQIRAGLHNYLPEYMMPNGYIEMQEWPLTPNGKVDREELATLSKGLRANALLAKRVAPRTETEEAIADIWSEVLNIEQPGVHDSFFELGGHSLLATKVVSRLREIYKIELPLKDIFASPTIATLAEVLEKHIDNTDAIIGKHQQHTYLPAIVPVSRDKQLPLSFAQKRLYFLYRLNPENSIFNMSAALKLKGELDTDALISALNKIVQRHESLRTRFTEDSDGEVWQNIQVISAIDLGIESVDADKKEQQVNDIVQKEYGYQFDLNNEDLYRFRLINSGDNEHILTITLHHIISDGWSVAVFLKELVTLYEGYSSGDLSSGNLSSGIIDVEELLPKLEVQYADYAYWQNKYLEGEILEGQLDYWRENLKGAPELLRLPTDRPRPKVQTYNGALSRFTISADLTEKLETFAKEKQVTPFMVLLSAYQLLLSKYSNQNDVCVGIPVAGRNHKEIENLIGFFINALVIRGKLEGNHNTKLLLANIKESTLGAFANQDIPAETLLDALKVKRNLAYSPLAQVGFALQNIAFDQGTEQTDDSRYQLKGLEIEQLEAEHVTAKYDLTLMLNESKSTDNKGIILKELVGVAEYNTDLFNESTIERMMVHYVRLLEKMISEPELGIEKLSFLTEADLYKELNIDRENYQRIMPLTAMQRDLYLATVMDPDTIQNSLGYAVEIHSKLDKDLWKQELQRFVDSQSILRTEIIDANLPYTDVAYQCVLKHKEVEIEEIDLTNQNPSTEEIAEIIENLIYRRYDPKAKYYIHNTLIKLAEDHYVIVFASHHMLLDGVGCAQHLMTVTGNYQATIKNEAAHVPEDIFEEFVEYDLKGTDKAEVVERWRDRLKDVEPLYTKRSNTNQSNINQRNINQPVKISKNITFSENHFDSLKKYCRKQRITPAHYIKVLYGLMINLYCNAENDFKISEFTAGRPKGHQNGIGCYYHLLPYIFRQEHLDPENQISGLFSYAREYQKDIRSDQQLSIFKQRQLAPEGNVGFMYNYIHFYPKLEFLGKDEFVQRYTPDAEGQVQLAVKVVDDVLNLYLDYQSSLFNEDKFLERLESLSAQILDGAEKLSELKYITAEEEVELNSLNKNNKEYPQTSLQQLLIEAVEQNKDQIAVIKGETKTTYKELYNKALAVASELQDRGIENGDRVCICLGKDSNLIAAITGTILAGGCYVPMDAGYPVERLKYIKEDSQAKLLITEGCLKQKLQEKLQSAENTIFIEDLNLKEQSENNNYQPIESAPEDLLYMIYTSGSTGKPKGSLVTHGNELNLQNWYMGEYGFSQDDKHLVISATGFDLTQKNLIAPILSGGTIVFTNTEDYDPQEISSTIEREKVTTINCAPSAFYQVAQDHPSQLSSLKTVLFGGEGIKLEELGEWKNSTNAKLVNMYGPTECTDITTSYTIDDLKSYKEKKIPIGRPIPNVQTYICNRAGQLLPPGLEGELCIAGVSVGAGYFNREELTAEKFISTTYADMLYRTGDIVKYINHQETPQIEYHLEYIERIDYQVKVRGQRIELGEIEEALKAQTGIRDAIVLVVEEKIWAYIIYDREVEEREDLQGDLTIEEIKAGLYNYLPEYMIPNGYIEMQEWPLTPNGKVDREELAELSKGLRTNAYVAPRTETEEAIADIWSEVLNIEQPGVHDSFFELGGHSLLATKVVSRLREIYKIELPLKDIFASPTIATLAETIDEARENLRFAAPAIVKIDRVQGLPLSFAQQRLWFLSRLDTQNTAYNMPASLVIAGELDTEALRRAFETIITRHEAMRTSFVEVDGEAVQVISAPHKLDLRVEELAKDINENELQGQLLELAEDEAAYYFELDNYPLYRIRLIKIEESRHMLLVNMHHIISDGWSVGVMVKEFFALYKAYSKGLENPLPELGIQYVDFAHWQRNYLQGEVLERQLRFWKDSLTGAPPLLRLPTDRARPKVQTFNGDLCRKSINSEIAKSIDNYALEHNVTRFMLLLSAYQILLSKYSGMDDICVGVPVAGRNREELEGLIGFFINAIVLRTKVKGEEKTDDFIERVKEAALNAFAHQEVPAELILDALDIERNLSHAPLAQVGFALQNLPIDNKEELPEGLSIDPIEIDHVTAKYDITLYVAEADENIDLIAEYNTDLFDKSTIDLMLERYIRIVDKIVGDSEVSVRDIELLNQLELKSALNIEDQQYESSSLKVLPLTAMQRDLYLSSIKEPDTKKNSLGYAVEIHNKIDVNLWQQELQRFHDGYMALRGNFIPGNSPYLDIAYQIIPDHDPINFEVIDLTEKELTPEDRDAYYRNLIFRTYNLGEEKPVYYWLLKLADEHFVAVMASHHIVMDGVAYAEQILTVCRNYEAVVNNNGEDISLADDIFKEFITYDKENIDTKGTLEFWRDKLKSVSPLELPLGSKPENEEEKTPGEFIARDLVLSEEQWADIRKFCRKNRITPTLYFKTLYCLLLNVQCGADSDFAISEFSAGRPKGHQTGIGCYYLQVPFVFPHDFVNNETTISELLNYSKNFQRETADKKNFSIFEQNGMLPQSEIGFMYNFIHFFPTLEIFGKEEQINQYMARVDGQVQFVPKIIDGKCHLYLYYFSNQFKDNNFLSRIELISDQIISGKEKVEDLEYVTSQEKELILGSWNNTSKEYPQEIAVHKIIERTAATLPDSIALIYKDKQLKYSELNQRANQIAHLLIEKGVKANDVIAICADRSFEMVIGLLAILKSGGAYLPIDNSLPEERIEFMLKDADVKEVLVHKQYLEKIDSVFTGSVTDLEQPFNFYKNSNPQFEFSADNLFNLIYTSGSTGVPKGVMVPHRGIINRIQWMHDEYGLSAEDLIIQKTPYSFDVSVWEFFWPLMVGSRLLIAKPDGHKDPDYLCEEIFKNNVTTMHFVPSMLNIFLQSSKVSKCKSLKKVFCSGEALPAESVNSFNEVLEADLHNLYGPTEASVDVSYWPAPKNEEVKRVPIGKPINNIKLYVLDSNYKILPPGIPGELYISGIGLADGYLNRDELNAETFINNPYEEEFPYDRIYKTGDLVTQREDGNIDYIGRVDHQVKLRGLRVELGEIESRLRALEEIDEAAVLVLGDKEQFLVAFITTVDGIEPNNQSISNKLKENLPDYMVPSIYRQLEEMPLSANGKLDRKALAKIEVVSKRKSDYVPPRDELEESLTDIWKELLGISKIGINDNFFELGGNSLTAVRLISMIDDVLEEKIPLSEMFKAQTIADISKILKTSKTNSGRSLIKIRDASFSGEGDKSIIFVHAIGGHLLSYNKIIENIGDEYSVYGLQFTAIEKDIRSLEDLAKFYLEQILSEEIKGTITLIGHSIGGLIATEISKQIQNLADKKAIIVDKLLLLDSFLPQFSLNKSKAKSDLITSYIERLFGKRAFRRYLGISKKEFSNMEESQQMDYVLSKIEENKKLKAGMSIFEDEAFVESAKKLLPLGLKYKVDRYDGDISHIMAKGSNSIKGWKDVVNGNIDSREAVGDHEGMLQEEITKDVVNEILDKH